MSTKEFILYYERISMEDGSRKCFEKKENDPAPVDHDGNLLVKLSMAAELLSMGLHERSVERLLNIRLDKRCFIDIKNKNSRENA